jgi:hypothetical protein
MTDQCFYEEQRVTQRWVQILLWVIWVGLACAAVVALATKKTGPLGAVAIVAPITGFVLLFRYLKLQVRIDTEAINYRYFPVQQRYRIIRRRDIEHMDVITYDPMSDYGGWGIRYGAKGKAYTVKGDHGLFIQLASGKNFLLGTSKPGELRRFLSVQR